MNTLSKQGYVVTVFFSSTHIVLTQKQPMPPLVVWSISKTVLLPRICPLATVEL